MSAPFFAAGVFAAAAGIVWLDFTAGPWLASGVFGLGLLLVGLSCYALALFSEARFEREAADDTCWAGKPVQAPAAGTPAPSPGTVGPPVLSPPQDTASAGQESCLSPVPQGPRHGRHRCPASPGQRVRQWLRQAWRSVRHGPAWAAPALLVRLREARYQLAWAHSSPVRPEKLRALPPMTSAPAATVAVADARGTPAAGAEPAIDEPLFPDWVTGSFAAVVLDGEQQ